ncbi:MAG: nucleotidyltransferase family protein [Alphaproteobacteria bacterium]|nr:nucleotidyltransferase family protein [Alphaproteobacteria bacterium]HRI77791.1 nucleotidyltransferase family protein [Alphaproteobacteria bacterium]
MSTPENSNPAHITKAFVLAAGLGARMRPLTDNCPKPLLYVGGRTMLDRTLDALVAAGVTDVVVNVHYLGEMIEEHLKSRSDLNITISREDVLLDTGGGVQKMIDHFEGEPFFVLNADVVWTDGPAQPALTQMAEKWDAGKMDILLLLHTTEDLPAYAGHGDYYLPAGDDKPQFAKSEEYIAAGKPAANYIFAGPRIVHPRVFDGLEAGVFSFRDIFLEAEARGRLYASVHDGAWHHVGTPEALEKTNQILAAAPKKRAP